MGNPWDIHGKSMIPHDHLAEDTHPVKGQVSTRALSRSQMRLQVAARWQSGDLSSGNRTNMWILAMFGPLLPLTPKKIKSG
jgi:hypothetical protein